MQYGLLSMAGRTSLSTIAIPTENEHFGQALIMARHRFVIS
jgi:hypothetical protein